MPEYPTLEELELRAPQVGDPVAGELIVGDTLFVWERIGAITEGGDVTLKGTPSDQRPISTTDLQPGWILVDENGKRNQSTGAWRYTRRD